MSTPCCTNPDRPMPIFQKLVNWEARADAREKKHSHRAYPIEIKCRKLNVIGPEIVEFALKIK